MKVPQKYDLFGVKISGASFDECLQYVVECARRKHSACIDHMPVHGLMTAAQDHSFNQCISAFDIVAADGQPVRFALNHFYGLGLQKRVYGPDFMLAVCERAAQEGISIFLYGSTEHTLRLLKKNLVHQFPTLKIAGAISPPFRDLTENEEAELSQKIEQSGAGIVFIGLGCPKQEVFAFKMRSRVNAVLDCVGAAFDFHAGTKPQAPGWMQDRSLEWLFRMLTEPRRLGKRYISTNIRFIARFIYKQLANK